MRKQLTVGFRCYLIGWKTDRDFLANHEAQNTDFKMKGTCGLILLRITSAAGLVGFVTEGGRVLSPVGGPVSSSCWIWEGEVGSPSTSASLSSGTGSSFLCITDLAYSCRTCDKAPFSQRCEKLKTLKTFIKTFQKVKISILTWILIGLFPACHYLQSKLKLFRYINLQKLKRLLSHPSQY